MQIKIYSIPIPEGDVFNEEMNKFLRSHKILKVDQQVVSNTDGSYWCFSIQYQEGATPSKEREKVDYMKTLDADTFQRFSTMRVLRKQIAIEDAVPAFAVFTDEELAEIARISPPLTLEALKAIPGIGAKKLEKYGVKLLKMLQDAAG
jgi:superfamily II DNA helicase RecQ